MIVEIANKLAKEHSKEEQLSTQINTLISYIESQVNKHLKLDRVESSIIDTDDKNIVFMWSKIKRRYLKNDIFAWTNILAA